MRQYRIEHGGKTYYVETEVRDCFNFLVRVYEVRDRYTLFVGKAISPDIDYAFDEIIKKGAQHENG